MGTLHPGEKVVALDEECVHLVFVDSEAAILEVNLASLGAEASTLRVEVSAQLNVTASLSVEPGVLPMYQFVPVVETVVKEVEAAVLLANPTHLDVVAAFCYVAQVALEGRSATLG